MRDPFQPNSNQQLVREAQFGFTVIGLLVATLIYVAYYRLSEAGDLTPEHVRNSPVAMQVYPNSQNYDRVNHQMRTEEPDSFPQKAINTSTAAKLVDPPKRIMQDTSETARSLKQAAESIEASATRVASLTKEPPTQKPLKLVSNPAAGTKSDSGFKILMNPLVKEARLKNPLLKEAPAKKPLSDKPLIAGEGSFDLLPAPKSQPKKSSNEFAIAAPKKIELDLPKPAGANDFKPIRAAIPGPLTTTPTLKPLPAKIEPNGLGPLEPKTIPSKPAVNKALLNQQKPAEATLAPLSPSLQPPAIDKPAVVKPAIDKATSEPAPRLPKLSERSFDDLRSPTKPPAPEPLSAQSTATDVQTVSFETTTWRVKKGDSFWSIAQSNYGDGRFFRALYEQNRRVVPGFENLTEGVELQLPSADELLQRFPDLCPADALRKNDLWRATPEDLMCDLTEECEADLDQRLYETRAKDTLFEIARRQLGQASRYVELIDLNRFRISSDVTHQTELPPGIQLLLPNP